MASKKHKTNTLYKCPFCTREVKMQRDSLVRHIDSKHSEELPEGFSALRYVFHLVNKKPMSYHGRCTECKGDTPWDENVGRYKRQCGKKECHDSYVKKFEENMVKKTGHKRQTESKEGLEEMLKRRKISGKYKFQNGKEKEYVGTYEKKCLEFMDKVMNIDPDDILSPGPTLEYEMDGKTHYYITDFYYQPYNLIIEVKDGGDNPNTKNMAETRKRQMAKEKFIIDHTDFNYLRLTDNDFSQLLAVFADLKMQLVDESNDRVVHVNEAASDSDIKYYDINDSFVKHLLRKDEYTSKYIPYLKNNTGEVAVDSTNNAIAGYIFVGKTTDKGFISTLETKEDYRRQGIGSKLLSDAINKYGAVDLVVFADNSAAIALYKKFDFVIIKKIMKDNKPAYWMKLKSKLSKDDEIIEEGIIFNDKDILYKKNEFESGEVNLCFITGHSGSGKSTLTYNSDSSIDKFELDDLQWSWKFSDENLKEYGELCWKFFTGPGKKYRIPYRIKKNGKMVGLTWEDVLAWFKENGFIKDDPNKNTYYEESTKAFIDFAINYASSHKKTKFMVNGIQLFIWIEPEKVKDYAVYIKGTSALISTIRGVKRDSEGHSLKNIIDNVDMFIRRMSDTIGKNGFESKIKKWRDYFKSLMKGQEPMNEAMDLANGKYIYNIPRIPVSDIVFFKVNNVNNPVVNIKGIGFARFRSENIVFKGDKIYALIKKDGVVRFPGGGIEPNETQEKAAERETEEEAYFRTKNVTYRANYVLTLKKMSDWVRKTVPKDIQWKSYYSEVFTSDYVGTISYEPDIEDQDDEMRTKGRWYHYMEILDKCNDAQQMAIMSYLEKSQYNESCGLVSSVREAMNGLMTGYFPGYKDCDSYVVMDMSQNTVFADNKFFALSSDPGLHNLVFVNHEGVLTKCTREEFEKTYPNILGQSNIFALNVPRSEINNKLCDLIGKEISSEYVYFTVFGEKLYTADQIQFSKKVICEVNDSVIKDMVESNIFKNYMVPTKEGNYYNIKTGKTYCQSDICKEFYACSAKDKLFMEQILVGGSM